MLELTNEYGVQGREEPLPVESFRGSGGGGAWALGPSRAAAWVVVKKVVIRKKWYQHDDINIIFNGRWVKPNEKKTGIRYVGDLGVI